LTALAPRKSHEQHILLMRRTVLRIKVDQVLIGKSRLARQTSEAVERIPVKMDAVRVIGRLFCQPLVTIRSSRGARVGIGDEVFAVVDKVVPGTHRTARAWRAVPGQAGKVHAAVQSRADTSILQGENRRR